MIGLFEIEISKASIFFVRVDKNNRLLVSIDIKNDECDLNEEVEFNKNQRIELIKFLIDSL